MANRRYFTKEKEQQQWLKSIVKFAYILIQTENTLGGVSLWDYVADICGVRVSKANTIGVTTMANEMRDRLVELLNETFDKQYTKSVLITAEHTADHLIENGVVVLPCKVGDDIWWVYGGGNEDNEVRCQENGVKAVCYFGNGDFKIISQYEMMPEDIGTRWCLFTKDQAEQKLKEMRGE